MHVFFSSACIILLDLWTFSPVRARALLENFSAPRARLPLRAPEFLPDRCRGVKGPAPGVKIHPFTPEARWSAPEAALCGSMRAHAAPAPCYGNHSHRKIAPLVTKITYRSIDYYTQAGFFVCTRAVSAPDIPAPSQPRPSQSLSLRQLTWQGSLR